MIQVLKINGWIFNLKFGPRFNVAEREHRVHIKNRVGELSSVRGFYGLIGPDVTVHNKTTLYELFTGDGVVQGAFIDKGKITFQRHLVRTDKLIYEIENGRIPENMAVKMVFMFFNIFNMLPNILGLANTALFKVDDKVMALFERDLPYLLNIDFENKTIETIKKMQIPSMNSFSAHSKFSKLRGIQTLDYNVLKNEINYLELNEKMDIQYKRSIRTKYLPVIHDFLATDSSIVVCDAPIITHLPFIFENKIPVRFDMNQNTLFHVLRYNDSSIEKYQSDSAFYIFHYVAGFENNDRIEFFAAIYENLDFNELNIHGKYRKIILHKLSKTVTMEQNPELESMNLDFPVCFKDKIVLRNVENRMIKEFIVCQGIRILKRIQIKNRFICGEPAIVEGTPFLACFANDLFENKSYLILINLNTYKITEICTGLPKFSVGFHGLYMKL
jgi:carotenoid cleavage dioxygenase-like enzyme